MRMISIRALIVNLFPLLSISFKKTSLSYRYHQHHQHLTRLYNNNDGLDYMLKSEYMRPENEDALYNAGLLILQSSNRREELRALRFFEAAIQFNPTRDATNFNIAMIKQNQGEYAEAITYYEKTTQLTRNSQLSSAAFNNIVGLYMKLGLMEEAAKACNRAVDTNPKDASAWVNLGVIMREEQRSDLSRTCFEYALEVSEGLNPVALNNLGTIFLHEGNIPKAEEYFKKACSLDPTDVSSLYSLAYILKDKNNVLGACALLEEVIELDPNHSQAPFLLASLVGANPQNAPSNYISSLFDHYCQNGYEQHMLESLSYKVPTLLTTALKTHCDQVTLSTLETGNVIDLGTGTGLCAKELKLSGVCKNGTIIGCDLSSNMVFKATEQAMGDGALLYSSVEISDCTSYLYSLEGDVADLIVAGDVIVYIGDVSPLFEQVARVLRHASGVFAFTVEARERCIVEDAPMEVENPQRNVNNDYILHRDLRYAHRKEYIIETAAKHGMVLISCSEETLRRQDNQPLIGHVFIFQRSSS